MTRTKTALTSWSWPSWPWCCRWRWRRTASAARRTWVETTPQIWAAVTVFGGGGYNFNSFDDEKIVWNAKELSWGGTTCFNVFCVWYLVHCCPRKPHMLTWPQSEDLIPIDGLGILGSFWVAWYCRWWESAFELGDIEVMGKHFWAGCISLAESFWE